MQRFIFLFAALSLGNQSLQAGTPQYSVQTFETIGTGVSIVGTDLNNNGVVLGIATSSFIDALAYGPWMYDSKNGVTPLAPLLVTEQFIFGSVLNDNALVAGYDLQPFALAGGDYNVDYKSGVPIPLGIWQAVYWDSPGAAPFEIIPSLAQQSGEPHLGNIPLGINNAGQIVGQSVEGTNPFFGVSRAYVYQNGDLTDLSGIGGKGMLATHAMDVNEQGVICGVMLVDSTERVFIYQPDGKLTILPAMINPSAGVEHMRPIAMNDIGQIVGNSEVYVFTDPEDPFSKVQFFGYGFLWDPQTGYETLGQYSPIDINNHGQIAGLTIVNDPQFGVVAHAVVRLEESWIDLNDIVPPSSPTCAWQDRVAAINDSGQILLNERWCQESVYINNRTHLLTPLELCPADIQSNGVVDVDDLLAVINAWGLCEPPDDCSADIAPLGSPNGVVDVDDLLAVINAWGTCQ